MKTRVLIIATAFASIFYSCKKTEKMEINPLLQKPTNEYGIVDFEKIKIEDYMPAFEEAMRLQNEKIAEIVANKDEATFENTIEAYEYSGELYNQVSSVFYALLSAMSDDKMQELAEKLASITTKHNADILYNEQLFKKVETVYKNKENLALNTEQSKLLEKIYKRFVRSGAGLPKEKQDRLREIDAQIAKLQLKFDDNKLKEINNYALIIDKKEDLAGLPQSMIDAAAEQATTRGQQGKWAFTLHRPVLFAFLEYADNRQLREQIYKAYMNIGNNDNEFDNKNIINELLNLRLEKAQIMGYSTYADFVLEERMAKTPQKVNDFLTQLMQKAVVVAQNEAKEIQNFIIKEGKKFEVEPWDWFYYTEKIRQAKYQIDQQKLKEYFELNNVLEGLFMVVNKLYNIKIEKLEGVPTYSPEASPYKVVDATTGNLLGVVYFDFYPRQTKQSGAWMTEFSGQFKENGQDHRPVISTCYNFTKPAANNPTLLNLDEVSTLFHEFGHTLHGILTQCTYPSVSGTSVYRDFVELPSQVLENWATDPTVLKLYAKHYKTGELIPHELIAKLEKAATFNQGFETTEYLAASILDMQYHIIDKAQNIDVVGFEAEVMKKINMPKQIISRYRSTYFSHIFGGDYCAGYYSYIWAAVLDADAFEAFKETGDVFNPNVAKAFRTNILEKGGTADPMSLYVAFRGREPQLEPLLKRRGLIQ